MAKAGSVALACGVAITLTGCGSGGGGSEISYTTSTTTTTTTKTTTTTTSTTKFRNEPWSLEEAVAAMNAAYMGFDEENAESPLGVTISMAANNDRFTNNLFCHSLMGTECFQGQADCRMSASILNHKFMTNYDRKPMAGLNRLVGYMFNQTKVETIFGKCAMIYDGASGNNVNGGCGRGARGGTDCNDPTCAYFNQCTMHPSTPHTCTRSDEEVRHFLCKCDADWCADGGYGHEIPPERRENVVCAYEMPAFLGEITRTNHLRDMMHQRALFQGDKDDLIAEWNEIVIDNNHLIPAIDEDPGLTISAFIYTHTGHKDDDVRNRRLAEDMRDGFMADYGMYTTRKIPVVALRTDWVVPEVGGAFSEPPDDTAVTVAV